MEKVMHWAMVARKQQHVIKCEEEGIVADSLEVRKELVRKFKSGEMTLEETQKELRKIQKNAKKLGKMTRSQAFRQG